MDFKAAITKLKEVPPLKILIYIVLYFCMGFSMNTFGEYAEIAKFSHWWQIITCYIFYMIPISILLNGFSFFKQYAYGLVAMGYLEFSGYVLKTSYIYPNNILDQWFGPHTFALGMALFFALYFPLGNWLVDVIHGALTPKKVK
jgi:hypothetical protein